MRSPLRVSIVDVCVCGDRTPEVLPAGSELSLSSTLSSRIECPPCVAEESRLSEEAEDEDSEKVFPPSLEPPPRGCCAVCENGVQTQGLLVSGCEAGLSAASVAVLPLVGNHCPVLAPPPMEGTGLKATSVRGVALPFPAAGLLTS